MSAHDNRVLKEKPKTDILSFAGIFHGTVLAVGRWKRLLPASGAGGGCKYVPQTEVPHGLFTRSVSAESGSATATPVPALHPGQFAPWKPHLLFPWRFWFAPPFTKKTG